MFALFVNFYEYGIPCKESNQKWSYRMSFYEYELFIEILKKEKPVTFREMSVCIFCKKKTIFALFRIFDWAALHREEPAREKTLLENSDETSQPDSLRGNEIKEQRKGFWNFGNFFTSSFCCEARNWRP